MTVWHCPPKLICRFCGSGELWKDWVWPERDLCPGCGGTSNLESALPAHRGGYSGEEQE